MKILVLQHCAVEHPGTFREFWNAKGHRWHAVELDIGQEIPPLEDFDLLVVMGGPMDVWQEERFAWLSPEKRAIRRWIRTLDRPVLGICLGHQLMADALGGRVTPMPRPEVGIVPVALTPAGCQDAVLLGMPREIDTVQWHGAEVTGVPEGAVVLASSAACEVRAIRFGRHAYGLQFHVEVTPTTIAEWAAIPEYKASLEAFVGSAGADGLARDVGMDDLSSGVLRSSSTKR